MHTILLIDDEESIRWSFMVMLQRQGYRVFTAGDYASALDLLQQVDVDVLISDILLPGRSGLDILAWLREKNRPLPVVLITGQPEMESVERSCRLGAYDYLAKPVSKEALLHVVEQAVRQREMLRSQGLEPLRTPAGDSADALPPQATSLQVARTLFDRQLRERLRRPHKEEYVLRQLSLMFDESPLAVVYTKGDEVPYLNGSFERLTGYGPEDITSVSRAFELLYPDPQIRQAVLEASEQGHAQAAQGDQDPVFVHFTIRTKQGDFKELAMCGVFLQKRRALYSLIEV